ADTVFVYRQMATGTFRAEPDYRLAVGVDPSALAVADVDGDGRPDILVTSQFSGDVTVLRNIAAAPFAAALHFRVDTGPYGLADLDGTPAVRTSAATAGLVVGDFDGDGVPDLLVLQGGANRGTLLRGAGGGGFFNP